MDKSRNVEDVKTVEDHLKTLPVVCRCLALKYADERILDFPVKSVRQALSIAFRWEKTPQGADYWARIHKLIIIEQWQLN